MVKRTLGNAHPASISTITKKSYKRQRTDAFIEKTADFESVTDTCRFFEMHLTAHARVETVRRADSKSLTPRSFEVRDVLRQSMIEFELKHKSYRLQMIEAARCAIQLSDSFQTVSAAIDFESCRENSPVLEMLNLGPDATAFLKQHISDYAGVPSQSAVADWRNLDSLLR